MQMPPPKMSTFILIIFHWKPMAQVSPLWRSHPTSVRVMFSQNPSWHLCQGSVCFLVSKIYFQVSIFPF